MYRYGTSAIHKNSEFAWSWERLVKVFLDLVLSRLHSPHENLNDFLNKLNELQ